MMRDKPFVLPNSKIVPLLKSERIGFRAEEINQPLIETGLFETGLGFTFVCALCGRRERNDQRMEPVCTGPSWTDDHPPEVMMLIRG